MKLPPPLGIQADVLVELAADGPMERVLEPAAPIFFMASRWAAQFVASGGAKTVLLVAAEKLSTVLVWTDRNTCILLGDGATAVVLRHQAVRKGILSTALGFDGSNSHLIVLPAGGSRRPATSDTVEQRLHYMKMDGKEVFKHAVAKNDPGGRQGAG